MDPYKDFMSDSKKLEEMKISDYTKNRRYNAMNPYN